MIPYELHHDEGYSIFVGADGRGITQSLLTSKNLRNPQGISVGTLYRHAKEVEANCKRALALCLNLESPWKDFEGHYPSGKTRLNYLEWLRIKMYRLTKDCPISDIIDVELDKQPTEDAEDAGGTQRIQPSK